MMGKSGKYRRRVGIKSPGGLGSIIPAAASEPAGGKKTCAQRYAGFALDGNDWDGIYAGRRKRMALVYAGEVNHCFDRTCTAD
jgi:bifunctional non-homologous end joining protein LigD